VHTHSLSCVTTCCASHRSHPQVPSCSSSTHTPTHPLCCPHTHTHTPLQVQKDHLDTQVRQYSNCHVVHPPLPRARAPAPPGFAHPQLPDVPVPVPPGDIPGVREAGWSEEVHGGADMAG
jgi:hypothetical protein